MVQQDIDVRASDVRAVGRCPEVLVPVARRLLRVRLPMVESPRFGRPRASAGGSTWCARRGRRLGASSRMIGQGRRVVVACDPNYACRTAGWKRSPAALAGACSCRRRVASECCGLGAHVEDGGSLFCALCRTG